MMIEKKTTIQIDDSERVSGIFCIPDPLPSPAKTLIVFAHGAGNDMNESMLLFLAENLADAGYVTLRFNFPYKEKGGRAPDSQKKLENTWASILRFIKTTPFADNPVAAAGKSMGGRIASQMAAEGNLPVDRLIFLGYPLHPPGKKDKLRDAHLYHIRIPMLFFAGTRDALCDTTLLRGVLPRLNAPWELEIIEGGDHSFHLLKSATESQESVYRQILNRMIQWLQ